MILGGWGTFVMMTRGRMLVGTLDDRQVVSKSLTDAGVDREKECKYRYYSSGG